MKQAGHVTGVEGKESRRGQLQVVNKCYTGYYGYSGHLTNYSSRRQSTLVTVHMRYTWTRRVIQAY